ncbi:ATP-binding protein [Adlercreutzia sp. R25]|uniref:sensor histidine kinase n=1 Tax=Adlercreutzia shanghongiae TaxID=3111773 RepID=UPI002DB96FFD|nr:ATP-binding protein [Adlercreutzia sp. R25]MEC4271909.1 ATP-binding protein [Adlercreutzia sp. R25]
MMDLIQLSTFTIAVAKALPGTLLLLWGGSGPWRFSSKILNAVLIIGFAACYYCLAFALKPVVYIDTAIGVCLLAMETTCLLFRRPLGISCMLGAASALCLQMMQALVIAAIHATVGDVETFVASFSWPNMLIEPICCLLSLPVVALVRHYVLADGGTTLRPAQLAWLIPPLCVYLCVTLWQIPNFEETYLEIDWMPLLLMAVMTISGVSAIIFPLYMIHEAQRRFELEKLESDARHYYESMLEQRAKDDEVRRLVHDMRNQIACILETVDPNSKVSHLTDLEEQVSRLRFVNYTGNPTVDAVLNQKRRLSLSRSIDYHVTPFNLSALSIPSIDLCSLFGNALDNAIEACESLPPDIKPYVDVKISQRGGHLVIVFANPCLLCDRHSIDPKSLGTTKHDECSHGFGLSSMAHVVEKNGGGMAIDATEGVFRVSIMLPS